MSELLPFSAALYQLLAGVEPLPAETLPLDACAGRVLAEPVTARLTQPPFDAAAMDGYAIRWADLRLPWRVVGKSAAGHGWAGTVGPGEAVRIFTGAPLPPGADVIVVQEEVARADRSDADVPLPREPHRLQDAARGGVPRRPAQEQCRQDSAARVA